VQIRNYLQSVVTGDETMVFYCNPLSKRESMEARKVGEAPSRNPKVQQSAKTIMAIHFWNSQRTLMINFKPRNKTENGDYNASPLY